jgi:hypothetical protein
MSDSKFWFERQLEAVVNKAISSCYPGRWREDSITEELLRQVSTFLNANSYTDRTAGTTTIKFNVYKLIGKPETEYGDIALLTTIRYDNGITLKGVANFEAKKRLKDEFKYQVQSRDGQFSEIVKNTPYSQLLLYDFEPITQHIKPMLNWELSSRYIDADEWQFTKCVCAPLYMVAKEPSITRNHHRHSRLLTEQLCRRIFYGVDLHYDQQVVDGILSFDKKNHPMFVATLQVIHGDTDISDDRETFDIPSDMYAPVQTQK